MNTAPASTAHSLYVLYETLASSTRRHLLIVFDLVPAAGRAFLSTQVYKMHVFPAWIAGIQAPWMV
jgi:hypothetical protein